MSHLASLPLEACPFLVVDVETTGSLADPSIVELAAVLVRGDEEPRLLLDTLVRPSGEIRNPQHHGISTTMVGNAPFFLELRDLIGNMTANRILVAHNSQFDMRVLRQEMARAAWHGFDAPSLCTMKLPSIGRFGASNWPLWGACLRAGVHFPPERHHTAAGDALATARLLQRYLRRLREHGVGTLGSLTAEVDPEPAWTRPPVEQPHRLASTAADPATPRLAPRRRKREGRLRLYYRQLAIAAQDLVLTDDELAQLARTRRELGLDDRQAHRVHQGLWASAMRRFEEDGQIDQAERRYLEDLRGCLLRLGFEP